MLMAKVGRFDFLHFHWSSFEFIFFNFCQLVGLILFLRNKADRANFYLLEVIKKHQHFIWRNR